MLDAEIESAMGITLWESTLGHFLEELFEPLVDERLAEEIREHVGRWLHPGGPLGALRVGHCPGHVAPMDAVEIQHVIDIRESVAGGFGTGNPVDVFGHAKIGFDQSDRVNHSAPKEQGPMS